MRDLNRKFRQKNKTTDVLTFPADDSYDDPARNGRPLGDIVISVDQARRQAADEKHSLATEVRYLILHGILHALGYDHETDDGEMNALEVKCGGRWGCRKAIREAERTTPLEYVAIDFRSRGAASR